VDDQPKTGSGAMPELRVSEEERDQAAAALAKFCGEGRLTLEEFSQRVEVVLESRTQSDIDRVMSDLPRGPDVPAYKSPVPASGWFVSVLSGSSRKGRWRPKPKTRVLAVMGGVDLDLRKAEIEGSELTITAIAIMGGINVVVPEGVIVHLGGFALMGGKDSRVADVPILPGSPVIRIRAFPIMGGVKVRTKRSSAALLQGLGLSLPNRKDGQGRRGAPNSRGSRDRSTRPRADHREAILDARDGLALASEILDRLAGRMGPADRDHGPTDPPIQTAPDGTVTILFCDVSGFAEMTERLGDVETQKLLAIYFELVRGQVASHGGYEVKCHADEAMVAFSGAGQAVRCAIEIQRSLARHSGLNPDTPIRAHIGLHTGEAIQDGGDFLGRTVILASRITDEAQADEILVSSLLRELTTGSPDLGFGSPRDVLLQGVTDSQRLCPVLWT
jgi:class 3 adenylate cyclase